MSLKAQDSLKIQKTKMFHHCIGAGVGFTTGYGISYKYMFNKMGAQINIGPIYHSYSNLSFEKTLSTGITFIYSLINGDPASLYLYQGNSYYYNYKEYPYHPIWPENTKIIKSLNEKFTSGVGVGMEVIILKRIGLNIMGGYAIYLSKGKVNQLNFTGEAALHYKF